MSEKQSDGERYFLGVGEIKRESERMVIRDKERQREGEKQK